MKRKIDDTIDTDVIEDDIDEDDSERYYRKAMYDFLRTFDDCMYDLNDAKKTFTYKSIKKLLQCCLNNIDKLRDDYDGRIKYNRWKDEFIWVGQNTRDFR